MELIFGETVTVTTTDFIEFSVASFVADVGGAMGLWLGLGIMQFLEVHTSYSLKPNF